MKQQQWFENWFDSPYYSVLYSHRDTKEAQKFIDNLVHFLQHHQYIQPNATWLDTACGTGRHAIYLAKKGFQVTGTDLSPNSIKQAIENSKELTNIQFFVQDIRIPLEQKFDIVSNLFTSFGYFESDTDNFQVLKNLIQQSKNFVVLDYLNADSVVKSLIREQEVQKQDIHFYIKREIIDNTVKKTIIFTDNSVEHVYYEQVKLYTQEELVSFFEQAHTKIIAQWGDYDTNAVGDRCIIIAQVKN